MRGGKKERKAKDAAQQEHLTATNKKWNKLLHNTYRSVQLQLPVTCLLPQDPKWGRVLNEVNAAIIYDSLLETTELLMEFEFLCFVPPSRLQHGREYDLQDAMRHFPRSQEQG